MVATYFYKGRGRSLNAEYCERNERFPLTRAIKKLKSCTDWTARQCREILLETGPNEAHHVGKFARLTDYYDLQFALEEVREAGGPEEFLAAREKEKMLRECQGDPVFYLKFCENEVRNRREFLVGVSEDDLNWKIHYPILQKLQARLERAKQICEKLGAKNEMRITNEKTN
jgi:hypothetical protein